MPAEQNSWGRWFKSYWVQGYFCIQYPISSASLIQSLMEVQHNCFNNMLSHAAWDTASLKCMDWTKKVLFNSSVDGTQLGHIVLQHSGFPNEKWGFHSIERKKAVEVKKSSSWKKNLESKWSHREKKSIWPPSGTKDCQMEKSLRRWASVEARLWLNLGLS